MRSPMYRAVKAWWRRWTARPPNAKLSASRRLAAPPGRHSGGDPSAMSHPIDRLFAAINEARSQDPARSRTAKLMREGVAKMAKKVAEEAVEVGLDAVQGERQRVVEESADLIYNLAVLWAGLDIAPEDVWAEMERRERMLGLAEKLPKGARGRGLDEGREPALREGDAGA